VNLSAVHDKHVQDSLAIAERRRIRRSATSAEAGKHWIAPARDTRLASDSLSAALIDATPMLKRRAERLCGNTTDAEDLVQDTLERAMKGIPPEVRNVRAWLATLLMNLFIDGRRANTRRPSHELIDDQPEYVTLLEPSGPEPEWTRITAADVRDAADALDPLSRAVYILRTFEHQSLGEIAGQLGVSHATVANRLTRARQKVRKLLVTRFKLEDDA
jgi:RNA polymerase sigma-70 factor (ECF subfamily)